MTGEAIDKLRTNLYDIQDSIARTEYGLPDILTDWSALTSDDPKEIGRLVHLIQKELNQMRQSRNIIEEILWYLDNDFRTLNENKKDE